MDIIYRQYVNVLRFPVQNWDWWLGGFEASTDRIPWHLTLKFYLQQNLRTRVNTRFSSVQYFLDVCTSKYL